MHTCIRIRGRFIKSNDFYEPQILVSAKLALLKNKWGLDFGFNFSEPWYKQRLGKKRLRLLLLT